MGDQGSDDLALVTGMCGAEAPSLMVFEDGLGVPPVCTLKPHPPGTWHENPEQGYCWLPAEPGGNLDVR